MNNQELEFKLKKILETENFFDMVEAAIAFEKEYKTTAFFKKTKLPLNNVIKNSKIWYTLQFKDVGAKLQELVNSLNLEKIQDLLDELGSLYGQENEETLQLIQEFKEIVK